MSWRNHVAHPRIPHQLLWQFKNNWITHVVPFSLFAYFPNIRRCYRDADEVMSQQPDMNRALPWLWIDYPQMKWGFRVFYSNICRHFKRVSAWVAVFFVVVFLSFRRPYNFGSAGSRACMLHIYSLTLRTSCLVSWGDSAKRWKLGIRQQSILISHLQSLGKIVQLKHLTLNNALWPRYCRMAANKWRLRVDEFLPWQSIKFVSIIQTPAIAVKVFLPISRLYKARARTHTNPLNDDWILFVSIQHGHRVNLRYMR